MMFDARMQRSTKSPSLSAQEGEGRNPTTLRESQVTPSLTLSQLGEQKDRKEEKSKTVDGEEDDKRRRQASASRLNKILSALSASSAATANKKEWEDLRPGDHHSEGSKAQRDFGGQGGAGVSPSQQMRMNVDYMQRLMASHMNDLTKDFRQRMLDSVLQVLSRNQASSNAMPPDQVLRDAVREEVSKVIRKARGGQSGSYPMPGAMYPNPGQVVPYTQPGMPPQNYPYPLPRGGADREELDFLDDADSGIGIEG
uniref:Uncharacterized protein n=2 Tax=Chromera velia CCMP2878 TaxID=1169474 RepID=A0A0G4GPZ1_9ALVE|eukprot:Cvel_22873.t1-p1 / transcript=Cvel_22873.t1 / gene=Cvel_22873 / organism=Chromera_velia_CCMP2878 / gene_product=hypothetical protein / transcript_product=hypothetical protein / location=Cvel_scaffold2296:21288-29329(+) / protein_length=254 / sequence_SO=supercontig / SO=protein_coding / is_pseudo=false